MSSDEVNHIKLKLHFKYCVWILIVFACLVGGFSLYRQNIAISGLSNAGLLLSIVLAVIAILITLWDVAGQKSSIFELKEQTNQLKETVDEFKGAYANADDIIKNIKDLQSSLVFEITKTQELTNKTLEGIEKLKMSKDDGEKEIIIKDIENKLRYKKLSNQHPVSRILITPMKDVIRKNFGQRKFTLEELMSKIPDEDDMLLLNAIEIIDYLVNLGMLFIYKSTNGETSYSL